MYRSIMPALYGKIFLVLMLAVQVSVAHAAASPLHVSKKPAFITEKNCRRLPHDRAAELKFVCDKNMSRYLFPGRLVLVMMSDAEQAGVVTELMESEKDVLAVVDLTVLGGGQQQDDLRGGTR